VPKPDLASVRRPEGFPDAAAEFRRASDGYIRGGSRRKVHLTKRSVGCHRRRSCSPYEVDGPLQKEGLVQRPGTTFSNNVVPFTSATLLPKAVLLPAARYHRFHGGGTRVGVVAGERGRRR